MVFSLTWLPDVLKAADLKVAEQEGWQNRGLRDMAPPRGVMCHHTGGAKTGNMPSLGLITRGRPDLRGPLAQLGLGRDGAWYVIAAGYAQHAGKGSWQGIGSGNSSFIGIEAENTGKQDDPWPDVQIDAYRRGVAAILTRIGASAEMCCGHKEYALPPGRKPDPSFDMPAFRAQVAAIMAGQGNVRTLIPAVDDQQRPTLRRGAEGPLVKAIQHAVGVGEDGFFGARTEAEVRVFQRDHGLVGDGIVGPKSWALIGAG